MAGQTDSSLSERQIATLRLLSESPTPRRASWFVTRIEPRLMPKSHAGVLRGLRTRGLVVKHFDSGWSGDRWEISDAGREALAP